MKRTGNSKIAVVGWGRGMGHKGHMYLADAVITQATNMRADPYFFVSKTVGKDDPIFPEEKVRIYQKVFPQHATIFEPMGNLNQALTDLAGLGYQGVVVVVGADQKQAFQYLEKPNKEGIPVYQSLGLKKLKVISRQETNSKFAGEEGPRATPMREILLNPNASEEDKFKVWRRDMPDQLSDREVLDVMNKAESRLVHNPIPKSTTVRAMSKKAAKLKEAIINFRTKQQPEPEEKETEPLGYQHLFKPKEPVPDTPKHYHGWQEYEKEQNPDEIEESRIIDPKALINAFYVSPEGRRHRVAERIPYYLLDKLVPLLTKKYAITMNDIEVRPADVTQYTRTSQPELKEFAPSDGGRDDRPKFLPWNEFIGDLKAILGDHFDVVENVVKSTIKARFVPHDPMEFGPTMLYSYYEARAGRNKGAVSTRGAIQVGKYVPNTSGLGKQNYITSFNLLKGHPFERHFDLTGENVQKIADIIIGNTEGAYQMQQVEEGKFNELSVMIDDYYNMSLSDVKFYGMYGITRQQFAKDYAQYLDKPKQVNEFAPSDGSGDEGFNEETLKMLAAQWYNGDEDPRVERTLMAAGWEIGQDEGYDNEPGVFVVQSGDTNGDSYLSWPAHELRQGIAEGLNDKPEAGDKITWYHSNHYPELEGEVVGWKDGHLVVKSIDPSPRNTEKTVATYRVPTNNILSVEKQGVTGQLDEFAPGNEDYLDE